MPATAVAVARPAAETVPAAESRFGGLLRASWPALRSAGPAAWRLALVGLGGWMSFFRLSVPSWGADEPTYAAAGAAYWRGDLRPNPEHPPLGKYLVGASQALFGDTVGAARIPAAVVLFGSGLLLWLWLGRVGPPAAGPVAAVLTWSLPVLPTFPEVLDSRSADQALARTAMLDPLAAGFALAALAVGWWWITSNRPLAAAGCGALSGLACAVKLPAALIVVVPAVAGCLAAGYRPGSIPVRVRRTAGHALCWSGAAAVAFAATYAPMGPRRAVATFHRMVWFQRHHADAGHPIFAARKVTLHAPWWINLDWQFWSWGVLLTTAAVVSIGLGLLARSGLAAYLTAGWLLPAAALVPLTGLALPHYLLLWRPALIAAAVVGAAAAVRRVARSGASRGARSRVARRWLAVALAAALAGPPALSTVRSVAAVSTLRPTGYAALPGVVPADATVVFVGERGAARRYLPGRRFAGFDPDRRSPGPGPAAFVLDRSWLPRYGGRTFALWAADHGYRRVRLGRVDVWLAPPGPLP